MTDACFAPDSILRAQGINKNFGAVVALENVSFAIPKGEIIELMGDNGAGKSTLVKIISGVLTPNSGMIEFEGRTGDVCFARRGPLARCRNRLSGSCISPNLAVWANVYLGRELTAAPK